MLNVLPSRASVYQQSQGDRRHAYENCSFRGFRVGYVVSSHKKCLLISEQGNHCPSKRKYYAIPLGSEGLCLGSQRWRSAALKFSGIPDRNC